MGRLGGGLLIDRARQFYDFSAGIKRRCMQAGPKSAFKYLTRVGCGWLPTVCLGPCIMHAAPRMCPAWRLEQEVGEGARARAQETPSRGENRRWRRAVGRGGPPPRCRLHCLSDGWALTASGIEISVLFVRTIPVGGYSRGTRSVKQCLLNN